MILKIINLCQFTQCLFFICVKASFQRSLTQTFEKSNIQSFCGCLYRFLFAAFVFVFVFVSVSVFIFVGVVVVAFVVIAVVVVVVGGCTTVDTVCSFFTIVGALVDVVADVIDADDVVDVIDVDVDSSSLVPIVAISICSIDGPLISEAAITKSISQLNALIRTEQWCIC